MVRFSRMVTYLIVLFTAFTVSSCWLIRRDRQLTWGDCLDESNQLVDGDTHGQGSDLLGLGFMNHTFYARVDQFDADYIATESGEPIVGASVEALALTGSVRHGSIYDPLNGADWNGAVMHGKLHCQKFADKGLSAQATLRIRSVTQRSKIDVNGGPEFPANSLSWVYDVELFREDIQKWVNACRDPNDVAFPVPGYWDAKGNYNRDKSLFSFACLQRDVAKCLRHGYIDDANEHGDQEKLFEACTRMMRADYCGDGNSYTKDGTIVSIWDNRDIPRPDDIEPLSFEAAWRADGIACYKRPRWPISSTKPPECLDKEKPDKMKPHCETAADAKKMFPDKVLLFGESCEKQPCEVRPVGRAPLSEQTVHGTLILPRKASVEPGQPQGRAP